MNVQTGIIIYHFPVWPRKDVQMFKLRYESGTLWICRHPPYRPSETFIDIITVTSTNISVQDAAETWDYVLSTVVIAYVCSTNVRMLTGVWKLPGETPSPEPNFASRKSMLEHELLRHRSFMNRSETQLYMVANKDFTAICTCLPVLKQPLRKMRPLPQKFVLTPAKKVAVYRSVM